MTGILTQAGMWAFVWLHPFFISMTDINYNFKAKTVEVSVRIFTDDFEKTLRKNCNCKVDLLNREHTAAMNKLVQQYVYSHLQLKIDGHPLILKYNGYQKEEESTWSYFEAVNISSPHKITMTNTLLYDYKEEQINMLHIKMNGREITDKLNFPEELFSIDLSSP